VAFDWGIAAQMLFVAPMVAAGVGFGEQMAGYGPVARIAAAGATLLLAVPLAVGGELIRRGTRWMRLPQVLLNSGLAVYGIVQIPETIGELQGGQLSGLVRTAYLLVASPFIVWALTRPRTRRWFATTTGAAARRRHGSVRWLLTIAAIALVGGASIAFSAYY